MLEPFVMEHRVKENRVAETCGTRCHAGTGAGMTGETARFSAFALVAIPAALGEAES
jgi:hypothetical protein